MVMVVIMAMTMRTTTTKMTTTMTATMTITKVKNKRLFLNKKVKLILTDVNSSNINFFFLLTSKKGLRAIFMPPPPIKNIPS